MPPLPSSIPQNFTALIVGATSGIGRSIALNLAKTYPESNITIAGRSVERGQEIVRLARESRVGGESVAQGLGKIEFKQVDACVMDDVKRFVKEYREAELKATDGKKVPQVDILVLSQGIFTTQGRTPAHEGSQLDQKMALHYYSRMLFIDELLKPVATPSPSPSSATSKDATPLLSPSAIIMSVLDGKGSSATSKHINWSDLDLRGPNIYGLRSAAEHCMGMTDIQFQDLAKTQQASRTFVHAFPGFVATDIMNNSNMPGLLKMVSRGFLSLAATDPDVCASRMINGMFEAKRKDENPQVGGIHKGWWNITEKGVIIENKPEADEEHRKIVREHTKKTIEEELTTN